MSQIAFYILSDVHGFIFPTDFSSREKDLPMGLLKANHLIEQDCVHYDGSVRSIMGTSYKVLHYVTT